MSVGSLGALALVFGVATAHAVVVEPNGDEVPGPSEDVNEVPLQTYFDEEGEAVDAVADANAEPGVFSPLCDFEATLVLSESNAEAGIAWYNVPEDDPTSPPAEVYELVPEDAEVGQTVGSGDIREHPDYAGGNIGFALMRYGGPVYYSEYQRNALCSGCETPGHWVTTLAYPSTAYPNTYYIAFEDWPGANSDPTSWQNDGDFNDKVFRVGGVVCIGGGEPCETEQLGVCAVGRTECVVGGEVECRPQIAPSAEVCDNLDNDCDGEVDDGDDLCETPNVCFRGRCVPPCGTGEFVCPAGLTCTDDVCVDAACKDVNCTEGSICVGGECVGGCEGVVCPLGQSCQLGRCVDLCAETECGVGEVCREGVCVVSCDCSGCDEGEECAASGDCVPGGCADVACDVGEVCTSGGVCVDACTNAVCPGGVECVEGVCGDYDPANEDPVEDPIDPIQLGGTGGTLSGSGGSEAPGGGGSDASDVEAPSSDSGCSCRAASGPHRFGIGWLLVAAAALGMRRRRLRP